MIPLTVPWETTLLAAQYNDTIHRVTLSSKQVNFSWSIVVLLATASLNLAHDVVVYGGTASGAIAAIQVARMGKTAILIEPGQHIGGLTSGGLGWTDTGNKAVIGGLSREFYQRVKKHYENDASWTFGRRDDFKTFRKDEDAV